MYVDMHVHSNYSDGSASLFSLIETAESKGLEVLGIVDHGELHICGMRWEDARKRNEKIKMYNESHDVRILSGIELDIDISGGVQRVMENFDIIYGAIHESCTGEEYASAVKRAIREGNLDVIAHYGWLASDDVYDEEIVELMKEYGVAVEINSLHQLPSDKFLKKCADLGIQYTIGSDAHSLENVGNVEWAMKKAKQFFDEESLWLPEQKI
ncbi:MAG: PHP domain-containing protein [Candidatus Syntropharchaeia archaeon]